MSYLAQDIAVEAARGTYDPRKYGAQCERCILFKMRQGGPVPPEINPDASLMVCGEGPRSDEVDTKRIWVGQHANEAMQGLNAIGVTRPEANWTAAFLCRAPGDDLERLMLKLKKENKAREKEGLEPLLSPMEACRPRLVQELRLQKDIIPLGKVAAQSVLQTNKSIMDLRGMPIEGVLDGTGRFIASDYFSTTPGEIVTKQRVVPTVHPSFVLHQKRWRKPFRVDLSRAVRWFKGAMAWKEPQKLFLPNPDQLEEFLLKTKHRFVLCDVETDAKEPLIAKLRCVGFSTTEFGVVVPLLSIDGSTRFYPSDQEDLIVEIMRRHFEDRTILKAGHNFGYYDRIVIEEELGVTPMPYIDTILFHRAVESELPHNLGFVGSIYTDVMESWKSAHTATSAQTDQDLWDYNITDCVVDARCVEPLYTITAGRNLLKPVEIHHEVQDICVGLHRVGMYVDQTRRRLHDERLRVEASTQRQMLRSILNDGEFNPNSRDQVSDVLFEKWGLYPEVIYENDPSAAKKIRKAYTKAGAPSTGDDNLRAMMLYVQKPDQKAFIQSLRKYRGAVKLRGTNVIPLRPSDEPYYAVDDLAINTDTEEGRAAVDEDDVRDVVTEMTVKGPSRQKKLKEKKAGLTFPDGRCHPHYNAHATTSQRLSSSEPNGQNWSRKIRDMICAQIYAKMGIYSLDDFFRVMNGISPANPGRALIGADEDQLELRFGAALAGAARYLEVFHNKGDPHAVTSEMLYGALFRNASESDKKRLRDFAKRFSYAVLYRATVETVHETLASSENDAGELVFPWLTLKETRNFHERWLKANPEIERWWDRDLDEYRRQGYLIEPVLGWRRDFLDGEDENEIANFKCQAGGSAIVHLGTLEYRKHTPFERWGPGTGLIQQGHDALIAEVPAVHPPAQLKKKEDGSLELDRFGLPKVKAWCEKGCRCITELERQKLQDCLTIDGRPYGLPVAFTAAAKAGFRWTDL